VGLRRRVGFRVWKLRVRLCHSVGLVTSNRNANPDWTDDFYRDGSDDNKGQGMIARVEKYKREIE
jgi:hypothetical protein